MIRNPSLIALLAASFYNGEGSTGGADGAGANGNASGNGTDGNNAPATFTQDQVNAMIAKERRLEQEKTTKRLTELQATLKTKTTEAERAAALAAEVESMRTQFTSTEEQLRHTLKTQNEAFEAEKKKISEERDRANAQYRQHRIQGDLMAAAVANDAYSPAQIAALLTQEAELAPEVDKDGKATGRDIVFVSVELAGTDGTRSKVKLPPQEALKRMAADAATYGNLFKTNIVAGMGSRQGVSGKPDASMADMTMEQYVAERNKQLGKK